PRIHPGQPNLCFSQPVVKGDADAALASAAAVVENHFVTQINHQAPMEPENSVAFMEGEGEDAELVVMGRSINIHLHMAILQAALGFENIRYEETFSGGQFGIKLEIFTEAIAAAAALKFRRPVRYIPSLAESMLITSKRHPFDMQIRLGADANGRITALAMDMTVDNGAYNSIGNVVINRALHMLSSSYFIPNIKVASKLVYTNNPWGSAARGAGPPQAHYALESAMDMLAEKLNMDPLAFRKLNSLQPGQTKATGHAVDEWAFEGICEAIRPDYERAVADAAQVPDGPIRRGVGLGAAAFGIGFPGDKSVSAVELGG
ncbi:xanthine dehydrogenase family protein molybdopterin-binding subunit, partial [Desulfosarcina cetonica]|uniref:xanthine dehydrogenase family protein molybdopterin-binding subunit n=1 Tax=Desulfosarcina cetonica TaxID=90730 RepID=UPI0012EEA7BE